LSEEKALYARKVKKAARMLFFRRHRKPGVKGWELKKSLGKGYLKIINLLDAELKKIGLKIKIVSEDGLEDKLSEDQLEKAWFFVTTSETLTVSDAVASGWRIDDLAVLAVTLAYLNSRHGKASRNDVEKFLKEKFPHWKISYNIDRFVKMGYLAQDENEVLHVGWRTKAEVDQKTLMELILT